MIEAFPIKLSLRAPLLFPRIQRGGGRWSVSAVGSGFDAGHLISFTRADPDSPSTLLGKHLADDS